MERINCSLSDPTETNEGKAIKPIDKRLDAIQV